MADSFKEVIKTLKYCDPVAMIGSLMFLIIAIGMLYWGLSGLLR